MRKNLTVIALISLFFVGCGISEADVQSTIAALPTQTPLATSTNVLTLVLTTIIVPTRTALPAPSIENIRHDLVSQIKLILENGEGLEDIESVNLVRLADGNLEIEVQSIWASRDRQPALSYDIIIFLAAAFKVFDEPDYPTLKHIFGSDDPRILITTYSTDNDYRYQSSTDANTLFDVKDKSISYEEWVAAANGGFR